MSARKTFLSACLISTALMSAPALADDILARVEMVTPKKMERLSAHYLGVEGWAGDYLSGRFAQQHHDWNNASQFVESVLETTPDDAILVKRAMVLAMGAGNADLAFSLAERSLELNEDNSLPLIFLAARAIQNKDYEQANDYVAQIPESGVSGFIVPLLSSWTAAANGEFETQDLNSNTIHIHHAILIADYMDDHSHIHGLLDKALNNDSITTFDLERVADLYAHIKANDQAKTLYERVLSRDPDNESVVEKLEKIEASTDMHIFESVDSPAAGVALAFFDTAQTLHLEYNDDSARLFAHLAAYMDPDYTETTFLLSEIAARHERYDEAIKHLNTIPSDHDDFLETQRHIADLLIDAERYPEALQTLQVLVDKYDDVDALIQIGDIHRREDDFKPALKAYNAAAKQLGEVTAEYWHLHYMRGICYERLGDWDKAERELQAALEYEPDHPFVLNYLGYAWADQGQNLNQALKMIEKAVALRPTDGYITDSLGWVLYRMARFEEAIAPLEKAVELLPYDPVVNDHLGDAYWQVGRKLEARFQWERAKNHAEEEELMTAIAEKLKTGLTDIPTVREAKSDQIQTDAQ